MWWKIAPVSLCYTSHMPELPEVETIKLGLEKYLVDKKIVGVEVKTPKIIEGDISLIVNTKIVSVQRFGKVLLISLSNNFILLIHLKMTGQLVYMGEDLPKLVKHGQSVGNLPGKHTHLIFKLRSLNTNTDSILYYNDIRKFGWIKISTKKEIKNHKFLSTLGVDALKDLNSKKLRGILMNANSNIKSVLLDQTSIAGLGNIYVNDALFLAEINPLKKSKSLIASEIKKLSQAIKKVLTYGLKMGGASEYTYINAFGESGNYQKHYLVYKKVGQPCIKCTTIIKRIKVAGRSTFFCSVCQK